ncbi:hypothetical protein D3C73_1255540 [compost metagenome]
MRRLAVGYGAFIPATSALILTAPPATGIVDIRGLAGINLHAECAAWGHLLQVLIETRRHHAVHPFSPTRSHHGTVKAFLVGSLRQNQAGIHIAAAIPVNAAQPEKRVLDRRIFQPHVKTIVG